MHINDHYFNVKCHMGAIRCRDIHIETVLRGSLVFIRVYACRADNGKPDAPCMNQYGRYWLIDVGESSERMAQTAWLAITTFEEHELREQFTYKGVAIFAPKH